MPQKVAKVPDFRIGALVLAAGASRRMRGDDKLLRKIANIPLIRRSTLTAIHSNCCQVNVVIQIGHSERRQNIADLPVQMTMVGGPMDGMATSLKSGLAALAEPLDGIMILLADMPEIIVADINALIDVFVPGRIVAAATNGLRGHPVCLPKELFDELTQLGGDFGARDIIKKHSDKLTLVNRPGYRAHVDLNTPEDWDAWLAQSVKDPSR